MAASFRRPAIRSEGRDHCEASGVSLNLFTVSFLRSVLILAQIRANKRSRHLVESPMKTGFYQRLQNRAKPTFIIRSQMLYPVELRAQKSVFSRLYL